MVTKAVERQQSAATGEFLRALKKDYNSSSLSKVEFSPFFAIDNTATEEISSQALVSHNIRSLTTLLSTEGFRLFLGCLLFNDGIVLLLDTFLTHRSRPCDPPLRPAPAKPYAEILSRLDHLVCFCLACFKICMEYPSN